MKKAPVIESITVFAFLCSLTVFIEATYIFGLLGTDIPAEIAYVLFLLSPFLLLLRPRLVESRIFMTAAGCLGLAAWAVSLPLDTRWRMLASGLSCGFFLLYFAARVRHGEDGSGNASTAACGGVLLSVLFRAFHSGNLFLEDAFSAMTCALLAAAGIALLIFSRPDSAPDPAAVREPARPRPSLRSLGIALGLFSCALLLYFAFSSPAVMARWIGAEYPAVVAVEAGALVLFAVLWRLAPAFRARLTAGLLAAWNLAFAAAFAVSLLLLQPSLGAGAGFPVYAAQPGILARALFWAMLVLHPVIYADIALLVREIRAVRPTPRGFVRGFAAGSLFLLIAVFSQVFTTVYDYIPVIGPWFRDRFWLVMGVPGLVLTLSALLVGRTSDEERAPGKQGIVPVSLIAAAAAAAVIAAGISGARPGAPAGNASALRVLTYNIQQGCGKTGEISIKEQMELMRGLDPDVIGLQETDTARAAGGNSDVVRFLADGLGMHSYYGPSPVSGTFGVALLSRYPILNARTFFMPSRGEQTAAIEADITAGGKTISILVTHLGNDGDMPQQKLIIGAAESAVGAGAPVIAMGDFNFDPTTEQYARTAAVLGDAWETAARRTADPGTRDPAGRIDHIFVSPDIRVAQIRYLPPGLSDHPAMFAVLAP